MKLLGNSKPLSYKRKLDSMLGMLIFVPRSHQAKLQSSVRDVINGSDNFIQDRRVAVNNSSYGH